MKIISQLQENIKNLNRQKVYEEEEEPTHEVKQNDNSPNKKQNFTLVEKYLKISDFIEYIIEKKELFLKD